MKNKRIIFSAAACLSFSGLMFLGPPQETSPSVESEPISESQTSARTDSQVGINGGSDGEARTMSGDTLVSNNISAERSQYPTGTVARGGKQYPVRVYRPLSTTNDPLAGQWWVDQTKISEVWSSPQPDVDTILAIIDTGFALDHEEFIDRWYKNPGETGPATSEAPSQLNCSDRGLALDASCNLVDDNRDGIVDNESGPIDYENPSRLNCTDQGRPLTKECNLIDDDGNGLIDDHTGWDFMSFDNSVQAGEINPYGTGTTHGTRVAGLASATGNNSKGIAGVDWKTKILPIQALDDDSYGDTFSVGDAIYYAIERGANVISLSLGSDMPDEYVLSAVRAASAKGIVVVAATGNDGCDCIVYPAHHPEVLAVGAIDGTGAPADFSSWGGSVDILAPGVGLTSTSWTAANPTNAYVGGISGTSFATPIVAGMVTRLMAQQPTATPQQLVAALMENTDRSMLTQTVARDNLWGFGRLDAAKVHQRMVNSSNANLLHVFSPVHNGGFLDPARPKEFGASPVIHRCADGRLGSTPIYNLTKSGSDFFTSSSIEQQMAIGQGYTSRFFAYGCVKQPHDIIDNVRQLNIYSEFKNISSKANT